MKHNRDTQTQLKHKEHKNRGTIKTIEIQQKHNRNTRETQKHN